MLITGGCKSSLDPNAAAWKPIDTVGPHMLSSGSASMLNPDAAVWKPPAVVVGGAGGGTGGTTYVASEGGQGLTSWCPNGWTQTGSDGFYADDASVNGPDGLEKVEWSGYSGTIGT